MRRRFASQDDFKSNVVPLRTHVDALGVSERASDCLHARHLTQLLALLVSSLRRVPSVHTPSLHFASHGITHLITQYHEWRRADDLDWPG